MPATLIEQYRFQLRRLYGADASRRTRISIGDGTVTIKPWNMPKGRDPIVISLEEFVQWVEALSWRTPIREDKRRGSHVWQLKTEN